jgi:hypothetical protein
MRKRSLPPHLWRNDFRIGRASSCFDHIPQPASKRLEVRWSIY